MPKQKKKKRYPISRNNYLLETLETLLYRAEQQSIIKSCPKPETRAFPESRHDCFPTRSPNICKILQTACLERRSGLLVCSATICSRNCFFPTLLQELFKLLHHFVITVLLNSFHSLVVVLLKNFVSPLNLT